MDFNVDVHVVTHGKSEVDALERQLDKLRNETVNIKFKADTSGLQNSIKNIPKQASQSAKQTTSALSKSLSRIQKDFQNYKFDAKASSFESRLSPYDANDGDALVAQARRAATTYETELNKMRRHFDSNDSFKMTNDEIVASYQKANDAAQQFDNTLTQIKNTQSKVLKAGVAERGALQVESYMNKNTKALKKYGVELESIAKLYRSASTAADKFNADSQFNEIKARIDAEGLSGKTFLSEIGRGFKQIGQFATTYGVIERIPDALQKMAQETIKVDDAMTQMMMATGINSSQAKDLMNTYSDMGKELKATGVDVATSATEWLDKIGHLKFL